MLWLFFIIRIAYNIAFAKVIQDVRSDDEDTEEEKEAEAERKSKEKKVNGGETNGKALKL